MKKLSSRENVLFMITALMAVVFVVFRWGSDVMLGFQGNDDERIAMKQEQLVQYLDRYHALAGVRDEAQRWNESFLIQEDEEQVTSSLIAQVQLYAKKRDVQLLHLKSQPVIRRDGFLLFSLNLTVEGEWPALMRWFDDVQREPLRMAIVQLRMEKASSDQSVIKSRVRLEYLRLKPGS